MSSRRVADSDRDGTRPTDADGEGDERGTQGQNSHRRGLDRSSFIDGWGRVSNPGAWEPGLRSTTQPFEAGNSSTRCKEFDVVAVIEGNDSRPDTISVARLCVESVLTFQTRDNE